MRKLFIPIFIAVLFLGIFGLANRAEAISFYIQSPDESNKEEPIEVIVRAEGLEDEYPYNQYRREIHVRFKDGGDWIGDVLWWSCDDEPCKVSFSHTYSEEGDYTISAKLMIALPIDPTLDEKANATKDIHVEGVYSNCGEPCEQYCAGPGFKPQCYCGGQLMDYGCHYCCPDSANDPPWYDTLGECLADPACAPEEILPCQKDSCDGYNSGLCMCGDIELDASRDGKGWCCAEDGGSTWETGSDCSEFSPCVTGSCETCDYNTHCQCGEETTSLSKPFCCKGELYAGRNDCLTACPEEISDCYDIFDICKGGAVLCHCGLVDITSGYCCQSENRAYPSQSACEENCIDFVSDGEEFCNNNTKCEPELGETHGNCPGDCPSGVVPWDIGEFKIENPLNATSFDAVLDKLINFIFWVGITVAPVMLIIAGFMLVTAMGDPMKVDRAKKMILYTLIGLAIVILAKGLIAVLKSILGVTTG